MQFVKMRFKGHALNKLVRLRPKPKPSTLSPAVPPGATAPRVRKPLYTTCFSLHVRGDAGGVAPKRPVRGRVKWLRPVHLRVKWLRQVHGEASGRAADGDSAALLGLPGGLPRGVVPLAPPAPTAPPAAPPTRAAAPGRFDPAGILHFDDVAELPRLVAGLSAARYAALLPAVRTTLGVVQQSLVATGTPGLPTALSRKRWEI